jgi:hypothetical protein
MTGPAPAAMKLAAQAVTAARIKPRGTVTRGQMELAIARALMVTHPRSPHGQALMLALSGPASRLRERPGPQLSAIRWLVARGQTPDETAAAARVAVLERRKAASADLWEAARSAIATDGPRAAASVAEVLARTGAGPTWWELATAMGWSQQHAVRAVIMRGLDRSGWLTFTEHERSLRPGPGAITETAA